MIPRPRPAAPSIGTVTLQVANLALELRCAAGPAPVLPRVPYGPFLVPSGAPGPADAVVEVLDAEPVPPAGESLYDTGDSWSVWRETDGLCFALRAGPDGPLLWTLRGAAPFARLRLDLAPRVRAGTAHGAGRGMLAYPLDQVLVLHLLAARDGLLVHAAGVRVGDVGLALAGPSGAGKTTLARTVGAAGGVEWLSDDRIAMRHQGPEITVSGTPWPGEAGIASATSAPLAAIGILRQGPTCRLTRLAPAEGLRRLLPTLSVPWYLRDLADRALATVDTILARTPVFEVMLDRDPRAVRDSVLRALPAAVGR
ncbi:MAG: hypothetical protein H6983_14205 [Ectothiorhodospiraceae bacterium]|nr:hypothetical protein [Chromatiales bacterium]MCP5155318.1 hypothetical protein [Ectothiorhodospiraceae bacterium]